MISFKKIWLLLPIITVILVAGCASVPMSSLEQDAAAKTFTSNPTKAKIYIYRNETFGAAIKLPVLIDNVSVGDTASHTYIMKELEPGKHTILSKAENDVTLNLDTVAGKNYFVWQEVKMGVWTARSALHEVSEVKGMAGGRECQLIE